jgi:hypothetical protein
MDEAQPGAPAGVVTAAHVIISDLWRQLKIV